MITNELFQQWVREGKPIPAPSIIKYMIILEYAKAFGVNILIETGTFKGGLIDFTKDYFKKIFSIELDPELFRKAKEKFSGYQHVSILLGDSSALLPGILSEVNERCLFWLDSHYSGGVTAAGDKQTPIVEELNHVFGHPAEGHIILIDDARCFGVKRDYPPLPELRNLLLSKYPDYSCEVKNDMICAHPKKEVVIDSSAGEESIPLSALIVTLNEGPKLKNCLESFRHCSDIIVVDLGSTDNSVQVARDMGARVIAHEWVPVVEMVWPDVVNYARNSWIIRADPDEVYPASLFSDINKIINNTPDAGMIRVPHRFYFRQRPLYTTRWGQIKSSPKVFHKERVMLSRLVHSGISCKDGFKDIAVSPQRDNLVRHYWSDSYSELLKKHWRYIKNEGEAQYKSGKRFSWQNTVSETFKSLRASLITFNGIRGGLDGIFLSFFHAWYIMMVSISLRVYQKKIAAKTF